MTSTPAESGSFETRFEALGFVAKRVDLDRLAQTNNSMELAWAEVATYAGTLGLLELVGADLAEDDGQGNEEIKCFVSVTLRTNKPFSLDATPRTDVCAVLDRLAQVVCCDSQGNWLLVPEAWETAEVAAAA